MTKKGLILWLVFFLPTGAVSFSLEYLQSACQDSLDYTPLFTRLSTLPVQEDIRKAEAKCLSMDKSRKEEARQILYGCLKELSVMTKGGRTFKAALMTGMLWQQLIKLDVDSAYRKTEKAFGEVARKYPDRIEGPWQAAINKIENGPVFSGIKILDSLSGTDVQNQYFWSDYAKSALYAFLPNRRSFPGSDALFSFTGDSVAAGPVAIDREKPRLYQWQAVSDRACGKFPRFLYQLRFSFARRWNPDPAQPDRFAIISDPEHYLPRTLSWNLLNTMLDHSEDDQITLMMDPNSPTLPIQDFVEDRIRGKYDSICVMDDFTDRKAVSIKCFQRQTRNNQFGGYVWVVGFDRYYTGSKTFRADPAPDKSGQKVRYFLALSSCKSDQNKAEKAFLPIVDAYLSD